MARGNRTPSLVYDSPLLLFCYILALARPASVAVYSVDMDVGRIKPAGAILESIYDHKPTCVQVSPFFFLFFPHVRASQFHRVCIDISGSGNARCLRNNVRTVGICYVDRVSDSYP